MKKCVRISSTHSSHIPILIISTHFIPISIRMSKALIAVAAVNLPKSISAN